jgi:hypothetical protein
MVWANELDGIGALVRPYSLSTISLVHATGKLID